MSFFEPPPPQPLEEEDEEEPSWFSPPEHMLGAIVPLRLVVARTTDVAVTVVGATAYPSGFEFTLVARHRVGFDELAAFARHFHLERARRTGELPPEFLRFGLEFADGGKATNVCGREHQDCSEKPRAPTLIEQSGSGGRRSWEQQYWVSPLPPPGPLAFVCEWPAHGIPLTRAEVDSELIRRAAAEAEVLWEPRKRRRSGADAGSRSTTLPTGREPPDGDAARK